MGDAVILAEEAEKSTTIPIPEEAVRTGEHTREISIGGDDESHGQSTTARPQHNLFADLHENTTPHGSEQPCPAHSS